MYQGQSLRLDRLVRLHAPREGARWWVLDYKSAAQPERQPQLIAQLQRYRAAVQAQVPGEAVGAAFLSGEGRLVRVLEGDDAPAPAVQPLAAPVQGTLF